MVKSALVIIDVQNDFCPGGKLPVADGDKIISIINYLSSRFYKVIATQDWHPQDHISFAKNHNKNEFEVINIDGVEQMLWPTHCVQGSKGAEFHKDLNLSDVDIILRKGTNKKIDSYSAFLENDKKTKTGLEFYLKGLDINSVYLCGLATDYCVYYSAVDAKNLGFDTFVIIDASKGVNVPENNIENAIQDMKKRGINIINSRNI